jgi:hypothetical protein
VIGREHQRAGRKRRCRSTLSVLQFRFPRMENYQTTGANQVDGLPPRWCPPLVYVFGLSRPSPLRAAGRHPLLRWRPICLSALLPLALCKPTADAAASRMEQARKIRTRLGGSSDLLEPFPAKPKGMLRRTFQRLRARAEASMYGVSHSIRYGDIVSVEASNSELASARFYLGCVN